MPRLSTDSLTNIIGRIYEAAEDSRTWSEVLRALGKELGSTVNVFILNDNQSPLSQVAASDGSDLKWEQEYNDYYYSTNIVLKHMGRVKSTGKVLCTDEILPEGELLRSEYYQDFLRRRDVFHLLGSIISSTPTTNAMLTLARSRRYGPWSQGEKDTIALLTPHLQRAVRFSAKFARARHERNDILNRLSMGIIMLDELGGIEFLNRPAEAILEKKDGLYSHANRVWAVDPVQASRLSLLISSATSTAAGKTTGGGGGLAITRSTGRPLSVFVAPMMASAAPVLSPSPRVAIFLGDPEARQPTNLERMSALFSLTPTESRMASHLMQGLSVSEAAEALGVTEQTARVHVKRILGKTYTNRQSELIRVLLNSPVSLRP